MCLECIFPSFFSPPSPFRPSFSYSEENILARRLQSFCYWRTLPSAVLAASGKDRSCILTTFFYPYLQHRDGEDVGRRERHCRSLPRMEVNSTVLLVCISRVTFCSAKYVFRPYKSVRALARRVNKGYAGRHVVGANDTFVR